MNTSLRLRGSEAWASARSARWILVGCLASSTAFGVGPFSASSALAQPVSKVDEAKQRFLKGVDLFGEGDFQGSLVEFKRSYELNPNYTVLYNIGQVYFQMQDYANALRTLQQYLDLGGNRIPASRHDSVEKDIEKLKGRVATVTIRASVAGAEILIDDAPIGTSPLREGVMVSSGKHRFMATKEGFNPARETKEIVSGEASEVTLTLTELLPGQKATPLPPGPGVVPPGQNPPQGTPPPTPSSGLNPRWIGPIVGWSVTGAAAIGWGVTGGIAISASNQLKALKKTETTPALLQAAANKSKNFGIAGDVLMGVTIAGAGVSTVLTILAATAKDPPPPADQMAPPAPPPHASVHFDVGPGNVTVFGSF